MKKRLMLALIFLCLPRLSHGAQGVIVFKGINPLGVLVEGNLKGSQKSAGSWTGTVFSGTLHVSGMVSGGTIQGSGPVTVVTNPVGNNQYEGKAAEIPLTGTLTIYGRTCALVNSGFDLKLTIAKNNQATLEMGSNRPSTMTCPGLGGTTGPPLLPGGYRETVPILIH